MTSLAPQPSGDTPPPPGLTVRRLEVDLSRGFDRHWHGGDAFLSQYHNALSMSFPVGEQSFIDSVRDCARLLSDLPRHVMLQKTIAQFIGQEATHRHLHGLYNAQLEKQGLVNHWERRAAHRLAKARARGVDHRHFLAVTVAYEHLTAILADYLLRHDSTMDRADPRMQTLWRWHAAEETEHRAVAFDLYAALPGNYVWRIRWYTYVLLVFAADSFRQTVSNLWHDGTLFRLSTWGSALKFFWGRHGVMRHCTGPMLAFYRRDFHPDQESASAPALPTWQLAQRWLRDNAKSFRIVR